MLTLRGRAGARAVSRLRGASVYQGGESLKLSTRSTVFKRVSLLIGGWGQACRLGVQASLGAGPAWGSFFDRVQGHVNTSGALGLIF